MQFKLSYLLTIVALVALTACSEFLNGKPKKVEPIEVKAATSSACLKTDIVDMDKFLNAETQKADIDKTFDCLAKTLSDFQNKVEGRQQADAFNKEELTQLIQQFTDKKDVSPAAIDDMLKLKAALIGGTEDKITKQELTQVKDFLKILQEEVKNISPYTQLFSFKRIDGGFSKISIQNAFAQLNLSLKNLLKATKLTQSRYNFENFKHLMINLKLIDDSQQELLSLAEKLNSMLVGAHVVNSDEDSLRYIDNLTEVLRIYSTQMNGYVKFEISSPETLENAFDFVHSVIALFENTIQFKKSNLISFETLDPLLVEIMKKDALPIKLSMNTAIPFYKMLLVRVFESGLSGDLQAFSGLKRIHLINLKRELTIYRIFNRVITQTSQLDERTKIRDLNIKIAAYNTARESADLLKEFDEETRKQVIASIDELKLEFTRTYPSIYRSNKIILSSRMFEWDQNWYDLQRALYVAMLSRQLLLGWGHSPLTKTVKEAYVSEQGLSQWYNEFRAFGIETKSFDPRSKNSGPSNVMSANLFTRSGNGDSKLSFREATELLGILFTGGGEITSQILASAKESQCNLIEKDVFGNNWNNEDCVYENFKQNYKKYFSSMNYLVAYFDKLKQNDDEMRSVFNLLLEVVRVDVKQKGRIETSDLRNMVTLLHYVESLYTAFDLDKNTYLSDLEIRTLYPKFKKFAEDYARKNSAEDIAKFSSWKGTIANYGCFSEDELIRESFVFMVYKGTTPKMSDFTIAPCLRVEPLIKFQGEVDRKNVINTFKIVKAVIGS